MRIGSLFSGIGGLELGLERSGVGHTVFQVEQSQFCRDVLAKHWPSAERFDDVRTVGAANLPAVDLLCGGFPCQDISSAGKGEGLAGSRSGLWFEYARIAKELRPAWVVVENVASGARRWVDQVAASLAELGYETLQVPLSAGLVGAPHSRERIFLVSHADRPDSVACGSEEAVDTASGDSEVRPGDTNENRKSARPIDEEVEVLPESTGDSRRWGGRPMPDIRGVGDGVPRRVDRIKALGNAVVPQCAEVIGWMIREMEGTV